MIPEFVIVGALVWYEPSAGYRFAARVCGAPRQLGSTLVVALDQIDPQYSAWRGSVRNTIPSAAVDCLAPRTVQT